MTAVRVTVEDSQSIIAFDCTGNEHVKQWDRFLTIEGKPAYYLGNVCGTCSFLFERLDGANQSISAAEVSDRFKQGLKETDAALLNTIKAILPTGDYIAQLIDMTPSRVMPGGPNDYFSHEQVALWGIDGFWGLAHHPKVEYYRTRTADLGSQRGLFEFVVPMFPSNWLKPDEIDEYKRSIESGQKPTALAISILDIKQPATWNGDAQPEVTEHWCLAHYLLDGHHKMFAASATKMPITLLSFLSLSESIASEEDIAWLIENY